MMSEKPILFNGEMVRAILRGRKTQTRRIMVPADMPDDIDLRDAIPEKRNRYEFLQLANGDEFGPVGHRYGRPGDLLWVRETHRIYQVSKGWRVRYCADDATKDWVMGYMQWHDVANTLQNYKNGSTRPSIFMPRWASRLTLRVTDVRVERVQDISEADAVAEGVTVDSVDRWQSGDDTPIGMFGELWDNINASRGYGWDVNPWVWVVTFEVVQ